MANRIKGFIVSAALTAGVLLTPMLIAPASAQSPSPTYSPSPTPTPTYSPTPTPSPSPTPIASPTPTPTPSPTGADSSAGSINDLAKQRFNQMITNRVLGTVLLGINEQVNCGDCVSAFGSAGSFSAGIHGRKNLTANLSLLAGIAYTHYSEGGYSVTAAPIGAFALRYDFADWGSSRPFFDIGAILTPYEKIRYRRTYATSLGAVSLDSHTTGDNYGVYGRAGWISRLSPRDEVAASVEVWQLWQRVKGYTDPAAAFNPFDASISGGTDKTNLVKIGGQWTHLFGNNVEANINGGFVQSFGTQSGIVATVTGNGTVVPTIGNQGWFEYGGRLGFRISKGWIADLFANGTAGPQPVGNTLHGGVGLRITY
ncbi:hypothetical protein JQ609_13935 [Bradyrhizobium sp. AUGA SZCCT0169]|uniref:hypothetical protein n=1 Tax=unclassified Bradyrhizobium TaxID=2631580 RepID=UPI001BA4761B|nr:MULTISPECIES: hypothetical protein [unclassified Bradyrhizobium]MBR1191859.1 hypothetical protein [Bradyrhizobium sp. AUGA SZCCT0160]MBR1248019.1 hypothetical protein [Bradyrhizobium sp. AUGA SZCCT0169]